MRKLHLPSALFLVAVAGCSSIERSYCDKLVQCEAGNDKDRDACVQSWIYSGKIAADYGCSDAWDGYLACVDATAACADADLETSCGVQRDAVDACKEAASLRGSRHFLTQQ